MDHLDSLRKNKIFKDFTDSEIKKVLSACQELHLRPKETLFDQGADSEEIYFLLKGQLRVSSNFSQVSTIRAGGVVGEIGVITGTPRSATIIAVFNCHLLWIKKSDLEKLIEEDQFLGVKFYRNAVELVASYLVANKLAHEFFRAIS